MKQKIYILGLITILVTFTGAVLKINHWPGAAIMLAAGLGSLVILFIPAALIDHYRAGENRENLTLYIVTGLTCLVVFTGMLFKINHWPKAGLLLLIALPFPYVVFLPVFLWSTSRKKNFDIYNLVYVLSLLAFNSVFSGLLSLSVSWTRIQDSYNISRNYVNLEKVIKDLPEANSKTGVSQKIDEVVRISDEYKALILQSENISVDQWNIRPGNLRHFDRGAVAATVLLDREGEPVAGRLENALNSLILEMDNTPGYKKLVTAAPAVFEVTYPPVTDSGWANRIFIDNFLPWSLIYLDALETNLLMIKYSSHTGKTTL